MKFKLLIIGTIISHLAAGAAGWYLHAPKKVGGLNIKVVGAPSVKWTKEVKKDECAELFAAYKSPINLSYTTMNSQIKVKASDGYKETSALWEIQTTPDFRIYAGIGAAGVLAGGFLVYKIIK